MTRKEAQTKGYISQAREYNEPSIRDVINKIYDDFESGTCENCKFHEHRSGSQFYISEYDWCINMGLRVELSFGCNKWEAKDD